MNTSKAASGYREYKPAIYKRRIALTLSETALLKTIGLIDAFDGEVGWHGTVKRMGRALFTIEDIFVYPQDTSTASVDTHQVPYEKWLYAQPNDVFNQLRMHGHSHFNFAVWPSVKDDLHRNKLVEQLADDMFYIFMIWNKYYELHIMMYDRSAGLLYNNSGIKVFAIVNGKRLPIQELQLMDLKKLLAFNTITAFIKEARKLVEMRGKYKLSADNERSADK